MAEPITPFTFDTRNYISKYGHLATQYSSNYQVSPLAVVGAIANEYDTRYNTDLKWTSRGYVVQALGDMFAQPFGFRSAFSHDEMLKYYSDYESGESRSKLNPAAIDVGPGNIKIATAIEIVKDYTQKYQDSGDDPLDLLQYSQNYGKLVSDIISFDKPGASFAITTAYLKQGEAFFISKDEAAWNRMSPDGRDALLVTFYKLGPEVIEKNIDARIALSKSSGEQFEFSPNGDGGRQHLNNVDTISKYYQGAPSISPCFHAGTIILLAGGAEKPIEDIRPGDKVLAFDGAADGGRGALQEREVARLFGGMTREWIRIEFLQSLGVSPLTLTPNHRVLTKLGTFVEAEKLIQPDGSVELVLKSGAIVRGQASRAVYSGATASLYEEAAEPVAASHGALALAPQVEQSLRLAA